MEMNKKELSNYLVKLLANSAGKAFVQGMQNLFNNPEVNKTDIGEIAKEIYSNLDKVAKEHQLTPDQLISIEEKKIEVLKIIRQHTKWKDIKNFIGIALAVVGMAAALAMIAHGADDNEQIADHDVTLLEE